VAAKASDNRSCGGEGSRTGAGSADGELRADTLRRASKMGRRGSLPACRRAGVVPPVRRGRCSQQGAEFIFKFLKCLLRARVFVYVEEADCEMQLTCTLGFSVLSSDGLCRADLGESRLLLGENLLGPLVSDREPLVGSLASSVF